MKPVRFNNLNPEAYLRHVLERIAEHPINRLDEILPWHVNVAKELDTKTGANQT